MASQITSAVRFSAVTVGQTIPALHSAILRAGQIEAFPHNYTAEAVEAAEGLLLAAAGGAFGRVVKADDLLSALEERGAYFA